MAISQENMDKTRQALLEHKRKKETDPAYRARSEAFQAMLEKNLKVFPHTEDEAPQKKQQNL